MVLAQKHTFIGESIDQDLNIGLYTYIYLIFHTYSTNIHYRGENLLNKQCWGNWLSMCREMKLDSFLSRCKINSKWIKDLMLDQKC